MDNLDFIYKRHSVRKFKNMEIPQEHIHEIIKAATYAPSGKNTQNWHFVVLKNKDKIRHIAKLIEDKNDKMATWVEEEKLKREITKFKYYHTIFKEAPVLVFIYAGPYREMAVEAYKAHNASSKELHEIMRISPAIQGVSAAFENLMLASANFGYGTCWMTGPVYAFNEIEEFLGFQKDGYFLAAMTPLGVPEEKELSSPPRKPIEEIMTILD